MDPAAATALVENILILFQSQLSVDNLIRKDAENRLTEVQNQNPDGFALALLMIVRQNENEDARLVAALRLKVLFKESTLAHLLSGGAEASASTAGAAEATTDKSFWKMLSPACQETVKIELLAILESTEDPKARNAVCDTTAILGSQLLALDSWKELQPKIFSLLNSPHAKCQVSGLQLLSNLVTDLSEAIGKDIGAVQNVLSMLMNSESADVRYECVNLISMIVESEKRPVWRHLQCCIPSILKILSIAMRDTTDEEMPTKLLISLIDIAEYDAGYFSSHISDFTDALFAISRDSSQNERVRQLALECVLTMVEAKPKLCKKAPRLIDELLKVLMEFLTTIHDDDEWVNKDKEDEDDEDDLNAETSSYEVAEGGLDRLAASAGGDFVLPKLFALVVQYLQHPEWKMKHAAMIATSQTVEHLPEEEVDKYLERIVPMCILQLEDPHPRVRFAACQAIGQAATDTQPLIQELYIDTIMPALVQTLEDPVLRIQSHAARALSNFCEEVQPDDLAKYLDPHVLKLLNRVSLDKPKPLLSCCVTALAVVAAAADNLFLKYYPTVVPAMKEIVRAFTGRPERSCREKALECITLVALAVGAEAFAEDTSEVMTAIITLWGSEVDLQQATAEGGLTGEGPTETLNESLCRMCRVLGESFVQYLPPIMPRMEKILCQKPHHHELEDMTTNLQEFSLVKLEDGKTISMKTQTVLELEQMTTMLYTFLSTLGEHFKEYILKTVENTMPLLEYQYCEKILQNALSILAEALKVTRHFADTEDSEVQKSAYMDLVSQWMWKGVEKSISAIEDDQMLADLTLELPKNAANIVKNAGPNILTAEQVYNLSKKILELLESSSCRNDENVRDKQEDDQDEDDEDAIDGEERYELELDGGLVEILGAIVEHHSDLFCQTAAANLAVEFIQTKIILAANPRHAGNGGGLPLALALYVICVLIGIGQKAADRWTQFIPAIIEAIGSHDPVVRQPAAHAIKLIAKTTTGMLAETVVTATRALVDALEKADRMKMPLQENAQAAVDNIVAAIGAMVFQQSDHLTAANDPCLAPSRLLNVWLQHLPLKADDIEGPLVHDDLVRLVLAKNMEVVGQDMCNMPHLLKIFAQIYRTAHSTNETDIGLIRIAQSIGESAVQDMNLQLDKEQQKNLERLFVDARQAAVGPTPVS